MRRTDGKALNILSAPVVEKFSADRLSARWWDGKHTYDYYYYYYLERLHVRWLWWGDVWKRCFRKWIYTRSDAMCVCVDSDIA